MSDKPKFDIESAFRQMAEAQQQIDASARKIVEGIQRMIDAAEEEGPSTRDALRGRDFSWYEATAKALSNEGFGRPQGFEPIAWMSRPIESRALVEYALGDGGTVVGSWFAMPAKGARAEHRVVVFSSVSEDGHTFTTIRNGSRSNLPQLPTTRVDYVDAQLSLVDVLKMHRDGVARHGVSMRRFSDVASFLAARTEEGERAANFRRDQGLALVERYLAERFQGDQAEVGAAYLDAIRAHPEWYAYSDRGRKTADSDPAPSSTANGIPAMPLNFLMSAREDGRRTITTFGMLFAGVPELLLDGIAANHCRSARFLLATVARGIARARAEAGSDDAFLAALVSAAGAPLKLVASDAVAKESGRPRPALPAPVDVHITLRGFTPDDEPSLLGVDPLPAMRGSFDERLRAACLQLGHDAPAGRAADSMNDAMQDAHARAVAGLPEMKRRVQSGLGDGLRCCVKMRATSGDAGEYVWIQVHSWRDGELSGEVITPAPRVNLAAGQRLTIEEEQVFDHLIAGPHGIVEPSLTDQVAEDYGLDI